MGSLDGPRSRATRLAMGADAVADEAAKAMLPLEPMDVDRRSASYKQSASQQYWIKFGAALVLLVVGSLAIATAAKSVLRYHDDFFDPEVSTNARVDYVCEAPFKCARAPARLGTNVSANSRYMLIPAPFVVALIYVLTVMIKWFGDPAKAQTNTFYYFFNSLRPDGDEDHLSFGVDLPVMLGTVLLLSVTLPMMNFTFVIHNFVIVLLVTVQQLAMQAIHTIAQSMSSLLDTASDTFDAIAPVTGEVRDRIVRIQSSVVRTLFVAYALVGVVFIGVLVYQLVVRKDVGPDLEYNYRLTMTVTIATIVFAGLRLALVGIAAFRPLEWLAAHKVQGDERGAFKPMYKTLHTLILTAEIIVVYFAYTACAYRKWFD